MSAHFNVMEFISAFTQISNRQLEKETQAANYIMNILHEHAVPFTQQIFTTQIPKWNNATLLADGKHIDCIPTGLKSGKISSHHHLLSSLISSQKNLYDWNINFSPECDGISRSNHYFAPSLAVSKKDIPTILSADKIEGEVDVEPVNHESVNILVGNTINPQSIIFCHYDSLGPGAIDNASGTALLLDGIINFPKTQKNHLYVIGANEELSYDEGIYWGHGYRVFEEEYFSLLKQTSNIIVVDCVGNDMTTHEKNIDTIRLGLPLKNLDNWAAKTSMLYGSLEKLMEVYHSDLDTPENIKEEYMIDAQKQLHTLLR